MPRLRLASGRRPTVLQYIALTHWVIGKEPSQTDGWPYGSGPNAEVGGASSRGADLRVVVRRLAIHLPGIQTRGGRGRLRNVRGPFRHRRRSRQAQAQAAEQAP